jgi:hypothetical protein
LLLLIQDTAGVQDGCKRVISINLADLLPGYYSIDIIGDETDENDDYEEELE